MKNENENDNEKGGSNKIDDGENDYDKGSGREQGRFGNNGEELQ